MEIGVIGFGRFGKLLVRYLSKDFKVYVSNKSDKTQEIRECNATPASIEDVCSKDIVIPCVPISQFEGVLKKIKNLLRKNSLIADICSVKEYPADLMKKILPDDIQILATHPIFGPDSASDSLEGRKIVLCKVRISDKYYKNIKSYLKEKGLVVIETTPEDHDKEVARSLVLTHFIGRALMELKAGDIKIDTEGYKRLLKILETVKNDSYQLFEDMNFYNKYSKEIREDFIRALNKVDERLRK
jgi:prephenate dehydrogenase